MNIRKTNLDLLRILGCMFVIAIHVSSAYYLVAGNVNWFVVNHYSIIEAGVPIFLMLYGYFAYNKQLTFKKGLKSFVTKVLVPIIVVGTLIDLFLPFWYTTGFINEEFSFLTIFQSIIYWDHSYLTQGFYLWYPFYYGIIILWYPILRLLCEDNPRANVARRYAIITGFIVLILINTIRKINPNLPPTPQYFITFLPNHILLYSVIGYEISFIYKKYFNNLIKRKIIMSMCCIVALLSIYTTIYLNKTYSGISQEGWNTSLVTVNALGVFIFSISLFVIFAFIEIPINKISGCIHWISGKTFVIYLLHWPVFLKLRSTLIENYLYKNLDFKLFYYLYILLIFIISLAISASFDFCYTKIKEFFCSFIKRLRE